MIASYNHSVAFFLIYYNLSTLPPSELGGIPSPNLDWALALVLIPRHVTHGHLQANLPSVHYDPNSHFNSCVPLHTYTYTLHLL
jgi:hypothetical protein